MTTFSKDLNRLSYLLTNAKDLVHFDSLLQDAYHEFLGHLSVFINRYPMMVDGDLMRNPELTIELEEIFGLYTTFDRLHLLGYGPFDETLGESDMPAMDIIYASGFDRLEELNRLARPLTIKECNEFQQIQFKMLEKVRLFRNHLTNKVAMLAYSCIALHPNA